MDSQEENDNKASATDLILEEQKYSLDSNKMPKHMSKSPKIVVSDRFL